MTGATLDKQMEAYRHMADFWYNKSMEQRTRLYDILAVVRKNEKELSDAEAMERIRELTKEIP